MRLPEPMTPDELAAELVALAERIRSGDSLEGSLEYLLPDLGDVEQHEGDESIDPAGVRCPHLMVRAAWRVGNRTGGQGGMQMIGRWSQEEST